VNDSHFQINYWAVVVATVAAFVAGAVWYSPLLFGKAYMTLRGLDPGALADMKPQARELLGEFVRCLFFAFVLAHFVVRLGVGGWKGAALLGLGVGVGFQATLLFGAVIHENMPWKLYAIHAGDALVKTLLMAVVLGVWRR